MSNSYALKVEYTNNQLNMCRKEIENDHLYKEVMERIEDEWNTHKANTMEKPTIDEMPEYIAEFKHEQANQENSGEDYCIEFDNIKQLMLYQKWCYLSVNENYDECVLMNDDLFNMKTLKNQVIYWIMEDFEGFDEDWEEEDDDDDEE